MENQDKKTDGANENKQTPDTKGKKRTASVNEDIWKLLSRNYLKGGQEGKEGVEMITEAMDAGSDINKLVIQRDTVLFNGEPVSVTTIAIHGFSLKWFPKDGSQNDGKYGYSVSRG